MHIACPVYGRTSGSRRKIEPIMGPIGALHDTLLTHDSEAVLSQRAQLESISGLDCIFIPMLQHDRQAQIRRTAPRRTSMAHCGKSSPMLKHCLQRGDHRLREEREGIDDIALAGTVLTDEKGGIVEFHLLLGKAAETMQYQAAENGISHKSPRYSPQHSVAQAFPMHPQGCWAERALASRRKSRPRSDRPQGQLDVRTALGPDVPWHQWQPFC